MMSTIVQDNTISYLKEGLALNFKRKMFLTDNVHLCFEKHQLGTAMLYFADHAGSSVSIPEGLQVLKDGNGKGGGEPVVPLGTNFILSCDHHYDIFINDDLFYRLRKQKQHYVHGPVSTAARKMMAVGARARANWAAQELAQIEEALAVAEADEADGEDETCP